MARLDELATRAGARTRLELYRWSPELTPELERAVADAKHAGVPSGAWT